MDKIAFLFLTIDGINHHDLWKRFINDKKAVAYIHSKNNVSYDWVTPIETVNTGWGYIVEAYFKLINVALEDKSIKYFVTVSESCIPICSFEDFYKEITRLGDKSMIKQMEISKYDQQFRIESEPNFDRLGIKFMKHYARFCLSRKHAEKLMSVDFDIISHFSNMQVGDEFFLSSLSLTKTEFINKAITFDNWDAVKREIETLKKEKASEEEIKKIGRNPKTYLSIEEKDIIEATNTRSFFWRKFPAKSPVPDIYYIHIPKTAGTSIEQIFYKYGYFVGSGYFYKNKGMLSFLKKTKYSDISPWHIPIKHLSKELKADISKKIKFAVVRNPYSRIISDFKFWNKYFEDRKRKKPKSLSNINTFIDEFRDDPLAFDCHFTPMTEYVDNSTHILKFENLSEEFKVFVRIFGLIVNPSDIDKVKVNSTKKTNLEFNLSSKKFIKEHYKDDFLRFGYDIDYSP